MPHGPLPSLKRELLFNLAVLTAAALAIAVASALVAQALQPRFALIALLALIAADVVVVFLFGRHLIQRLVLGPMDRLTKAAERLAAGRLEERAPPAETREFTELAARFNHMTDRLLDAQGQLVRAEKLASVGQLAAGVAHEIGNPLSAIGTYLEVLERRGMDAEILQAVHRETERIDRIVRGLLAYARPRAEETGPVDVGAALRNVLGLLTEQGRLKYHEVTSEIDEPLPAVRAKAHLLEQVMVNLLLNASDAAPRGRIAVGATSWKYSSRDRGAAGGSAGRSDGQSLDGWARRSERRSTGSPVRPWRPELADGTEGVLFWVADSGPGVAPELRERVFDPFYTSKPPGQGTGLGLAVVQSTVYAFGGVVWVEDAREGGAAFKMFLPAAGDARAPLPASLASPTGGGG